MPEWLHESLIINGTQVSWEMLALRLGMSLLLGCVVVGIYALSRHREAAGSFSLMTTLVMLTVLIAMVTLVIGNSVARAFSLVGALSIVRFRTIVEDTRDTAFVIFAVVVGMAVGAGMWSVPLLGIPVVALALAVLAVWVRATGGGPDCSRTLIVRIGLGRDLDGTVKSTFDKYLRRFRMTTAGTARQGVALELTYMIRLRGPWAAIPLVTELNQQEGIQGVELNQG